MAHVEIVTIKKHLIFRDIIENKAWVSTFYLGIFYGLGNGPPQVKSRLIISSIFYVMNFRHFTEMP